MNSFHRRSLLLLATTAGCWFSADIAQAAEPSFERSVYPVLQGAGCAGCHNANGVASATRLHFPEQTLTGAQMEAFGRSLSSLVDAKDPAQSPLLLKPTGRVAHGGGKRLTPGSPGEAALRAYVEYLALHPSSAPGLVEETALPLASTVVRRLTHSQYNNTVRDLLGDDSRLADQFPPEDFVNGFKNQFQSQSISPLLAEAYTDAAEKIADKAFRNGVGRSLIPCKAAGPADTACRTAFLRAFGRRAFRRPLREAELTAYSQLFDREAKQQKSFTAGAKLVVEAMLQSPHFLLRLENNTDAREQAYERASRLSYFLWNTMPDEALLQSAARGELDSPEGVEKAARRLLADPRSRPALDEFVSQWLRFDRVLNSVKDRGQFPQYNLELANAMTEETRRFVSHLVWDNQDFRGFYSAGYSFLNSDLAALYQVPAPAKEFGRVTFPASSQRAGILGQATFLALTSKPGETSPTARGLFVREQFLCQEVPQPPPGVSTNLPPVTAAKPMTNRERLGVHLSNESCASCHNLIDPIGFGMEKFDAIGQWRERMTLVLPAQHGEKKREKIDLPLQTDGQVTGLANSRFTSPQELGKILAESKQCQECVVKQVYRYWQGRRETGADRAVIRAAATAFHDSGYHFQDMMVALIRYSLFPEERIISDGQ